MSKPHPTPAESFKLWEELFDNGSSWSECDHFARAFLARWGSPQTGNVSPEEARELVSELRYQRIFHTSDEYTAELLKQAEDMIELLIAPPIVQ